MRILFHANAPWVGTGYGQQCGLFAPRLESLGHQVAVSAFYGLHGARTSWNGIPVYPGGVTAHGNDVLAGHAEDWKADLVLTLTDIWVLDTGMLKTLNVAHWMPVDSSPLGQYDIGSLTASGATPVAMSEFGREQLEAAGFSPLYAPHGIDCTVFKPGDKTVARKRMGIPRDAFVIGVNAANKDPARKAYPEQFAAFGLFHADHPDSLLLVHALADGGAFGLDLNTLAARCGIQDAIRWSKPYKYTTGGYSAADMAVWYSALDLYSGCAYAEGFGLPLVEAQACGVPVVTTDASAMTEMCGSGWLVQGEPSWNPGHRAWWCKPLIGKITECYEQAYSGGAAALAGKAREFALAYDADRVLYQYWKPVLEEIEGRLEAA